MEQKVGFSLCVDGRAEMVVNGVVCTVETGMLMLRTPLFLYLEMERTGDYAECELMMPMEQIQQLTAPYTSQLIADDAHFYPCLHLDDEKASYIRQAVVTADRRSLASANLPALQRQLSEVIVLRQRQTLMLEVLMLFLQRQPSAHGKQSRQEAIFLDFMLSLAQNYAVHRDVAWYAERASLTVRHFSFMIRRHSGRTPMEWIILITVTQAKRLLRQPGTQVKEVADQLGFPEQFTFRKYFKQHAGLSPREFQKGEGV